MPGETKIVKGGFRATLALLISIVALVLAFLAYQRTAGDEDLGKRVREIQTKLDEMRSESSERIDTLREEVGKVLERMGTAVRKKPSE